VPDDEQHDADDDEGDCEAGDGHASTLPGVA
jgi:hypothetical protein